MKEKAIRFDSEKLELEGRLYTAGSKGVVVTHPHPLYGGSLDNVVVETVVRTFQELGFSTLRFNFRGVGSSQGTYDNGSGEAEDTREALNLSKDVVKIMFRFLRKRYRYFFVTTYHKPPSLSGVDLIN